MKDMGSIEKKLQKLQEQQNKIQQEMETLTQKRNERVIEVLTYIPQDNLSLHALIGGLVYVGQTALQDPKQREVWHQAGRKFYTTKKTDRAKLFRSTPQKTEKANDKNLPEKSTH